MARGRLTRIYGLMDPRTNQIHYVGYTTLTLQQRLAWHIHDDRNSPRTAWLLELIQSGIMPMMVELEVVRPARLWPERERWWIQHGRNLGWPLTNVSDGGDEAPKYINRPSKRAPRRPTANRKKTA